MEHKHRFRLTFVGGWSYLFVCLCGDEALVIKHNFRLMCRGWNPYKEN